MAVMSLCLLFPKGGWPWGSQGWFGARNLSALGTLLCVSTSCPATALWSPCAHRSPV